MQAHTQTNPTCTDNLETVSDTITQTGSEEEESAPEERFAIFSRSGQQCGLANTKATNSEEEGEGQKKSRLQGEPSPSTHSTHNTIKKENLTLNKLPLPPQPKQDRKRKKWHRNSPSASQYSFALSASRSSLPVDSSADAAEIGRRWIAQRRAKRRRRRWGPEEASSARHKSPTDTHTNTQSKERKLATKRHSLMAPLQSLNGDLRHLPHRLHHLHPMGSHHRPALLCNPNPSPKPQRTRPSRRFTPHPYTHITMPQFPSHRARKPRCRSLQHANHIHRTQIPTPLAHLALRHSPLPIQLPIICTTEYSQATLTAACGSHPPRLFLRLPFQAMECSPREELRRDGIGVARVCVGVLGLCACLRNCVSEADDNERKSPSSHG